MEWHRIDRRETLNGLGTRPEGLTQQEAEKAAERFGRNILREEKKKSVLQVFIGQFADMMVAILIAAAAISAFTGDAKSTAVIMAVLVLNAVLGTAEYIKAQRSLDSLKSLSSPKAKVLRGSVKTEIDSQDIVPGDILLLEAGDMVTADGRIIECNSLQVNESALTGESSNVSKSDGVLLGNVPLADRVNMVYAGSLVAYGRAAVAVTATGMHTELGRIAELMNSAKERKTPLQRSLDQFGRRLAAAIIVISAVVFALGAYRGMPLADSLLFAVALAVAAIPEALSSIVTIVQAMGTQKMAKENAVIKNLSAVESLGCVSVICSDKTGTLTQNKMTVSAIYIGGELLTDSQLDISRPLHRYLLYGAVLTNDSSIADEKHIGDPTELALLKMYRNVGGIIYEDEKMSLTEDVLRQAHSRMQEVPFDSCRKLMSTKHRLHGVTTVFTKGAVDVLLERCVSIYSNDGIRPITPQDIKDIFTRNFELSQNGLRVLAFGFFEADTELSPDTEHGYTFIGLTAMMDPPRPESAAAVADAARAGIRTVMITGDHKVTARAIAGQIGIFKEGDIALTGAELDAMSDSEFDSVIKKVSVYARVSPENKIRIVSAWQKNGCITAMTGDGVNDAPALKCADIGVAMGQSGTEVSKDAASMILADDNFATIIKAVANGRTIHQNIKNAISFLLSGNLSAIITVLYTSFAALPIPFLAVQLLFINLVTDSLPALAIGMEKGDKNVLLQKPRDPAAGILSRGFAAVLALWGALIALCVIAAYTIGLKSGAQTACTMAFSTLTLARLLHGFNCRGAHSVFRLGFKDNPYSVGAFSVGLSLLMAVLLIPALRPLFGVAALTGGQLGVIALLALAPTALIQAGKAVRELKSPRPKAAEAV